ncbi:uncharacterized protein [Apostichopus japonicus]
MSEGKRAQVILLDKKKVELTIGPKLSGRDLLDLVVSYCSLKEKEYFGLAFLDDTNHYNWLQRDKNVLDHELPRPPQGEPLTLYFRVQYFSESIAKLRDSITIELFYLQAKESVFKGEIEVDSETAFELAAYVLQAVDGDYRSDKQARDTLKKLPVLPQSTLKEHPSLLFCEERILYYYKQNQRFTTGQSIVCYMQVIEGLPTYGVHYYEVKDKSGLPWWLGLSYKGIGQYDLGDRVTPRNVFNWKQLQNIYYQSRKFSIEVLDAKRVLHNLSSVELYQQDQDSFDDLADALTDPTTQVTVSRRTFSGGSATVHAWYGHPLMVRSMWTMAVSQHQFYLDRKHSKEMPATDKSLSQIANDLTVSTVSLSSSQTSEQSGDDKLKDSTNSLKVSEATLTKLTDKEKSSRELLAMEGEEARKQMVAALKEKKTVLEERLREKIEALKDLCIREAEITNIVPDEYPKTPGEPFPKFQRRMTTSYKLSEKHVKEESLNSGNYELSRLEKEFEIQSNIVTAARKLANDPNISKKVRKTRREAYKNSARRLDKIYKELNKLRLQLGLAITDRISSDVQADLDHMESSGRRLSFTGTLPKSLSRGRSKTRESPETKRSKSVPRQLLDNVTSPALNRNDKVAMQRAPSPVISFTDYDSKDSASNLSTKPPHGRKQDINHYETVPRDSPRRTEDGIAGDRHSYGTDTSSLSSSSSKGLFNRTNSEYSVSVRSSSSSKSAPIIYQSLQRLPRSSKGASGSIEDFRIRSGSNTSLEYDKRVRRKGSAETIASQQRPTPPSLLFSENSPNSPPPVYGTVPRSYIQMGRYYESPELSSPVHEVKPSPKHAVSMHNLPQAIHSEHSAMYGETGDGFLAQGRSLGGPAPTPKKHASLGNLIDVVEDESRDQGINLPQGRYNVPKRNVEDQYHYSYTQADRGNHLSSPRRGGQSSHPENSLSSRRRHNSFSSQHSNSSQSSVTSHQSHSSQRSQRSQSSQRSQAPQVMMNGTRNPGSHNTTPIKQPPPPSVPVSYASEGHHYRMSNERTAYPDQYHSHHQRDDPYRQHQASPQRYDHYQSRDEYDYHMEPPALYRDEPNDFYTDQQYDDSFQSSYHHDEMAPAGYHNGEAQRSFTTQQSYSQSGLTIRAVSTPSNQSSPVPQPAPAYMTSAPAVSRSPHPPVYGTTIAVSKVHYQPATPMTCEPVTRKKKHHSHHMAGSLPSLIALEDSNPVLLQRSEVNSPVSSEGSRGGYSPYIEDIEYAADIDEYAEGDDYFDENSSWSSEREINQSHPGKIRAGTLV